MSVVIANARLLAAVALVAGMLALAVATAGETTDPEALIVRGNRLFLPVSINGGAAEAVLKTLEVGGVTFENVRAAIDTQDSAGEVNIGPSILRRFMLLIDFGQHAIWLEQRK